MKSLKKMIPAHYLPLAWKDIVQKVKNSYRTTPNIRFSSYKTQLKWYKEAILDHKGHYLCDFCGELNMFFDDVGFFSPDVHNATCGCVETQTGER